MNPWVSIWFKPRQTIRQIVDTNPRHLVVPIAIAAGIAGGLMQALTPLTRAGVSIGVAVAIAVVLGGLFGLIGLYLFGWLYRWVGGWLGGQAKNVEVRAAIAWVEIPTFAVFMIWLASFLMTPGQAVATGGGGNMLTTASAIVIGIAAFAAGIWRAVLACHTLGEVHRFSAWKGLGTMLIPNALIMIPIFFIAMVSAIAIPNVLRGRLLANEAAAIGNIRSLIASLEFYRVDKQGGYPASADWAQLYVTEKKAYGPPLFKTTGPLAGLQALGYRYTYTSEEATRYAIGAVPVEVIGTLRSFYADETGLIRHCTLDKASDNVADVDDPTIDQPPRPCD